MEDHYVNLEESYFTIVTGFSSSCLRYIKKFIFHLHLVRHSFFTASYSIQSYISDFVKKYFNECQNLKWYFNQKINNLLLMNFYTLQLSNLNPNSLSNQLFWIIYLFISFLPLSLRSHIFTNTKLRFSCMLINATTNNDKNNNNNNDYRVCIKCIGIIICWHDYTLLHTWTEHALGGGVRERGGGVPTHPGISHLQVLVQV